MEAFPKIEVTVSAAWHKKGQVHQTTGRVALYTKNMPSYPVLIEGKRHFIFVDHCKIYTEKKADK